MHNTCRLLCSGKSRISVDNLAHSLAGESQESWRRGVVVARLMLHLRLLASWQLGPPKGSSASWPPPTSCCPCKSIHQLRGKLDMIAMAPTTGTPVFFAEAPADWVAISTIPIGGLKLTLNEAPPQTRETCFVASRKLGTFAPSPVIQAKLVVLRSLSRRYPTELSMPNSCCASSMRRRFPSNPPLTAGCREMNRIAVSGD
jgi:hypothetical protein